VGGLVGFFVVGGVDLFLDLVGEIVDILPEDFYVIE
jgi:hypothetical protein